jgi:A/G-specific adenine glycosylase
VWISEIMLQQTQVATVIPYFENWMREFPDLPGLAGAPEDEVLSHWSGLGYYARARNLHKTARLCIEIHDGELPQTTEELVALPGIGLSTANAIISQATDRPAAVLDGNAKRTLARHALVEGWYGTSHVLKQLWDEAEKRLPENRGADYTQAIMDLGALVCTRNNPDCGHCPVSGDCLAKTQGKTDRIPASKPKRHIGQSQIWMLIVSDQNGRVLLEKRPPAGIWGGLWVFPSGEDPQTLCDRIGVSSDELTNLEPRTHSLTHLQMNIQPLFTGKFSPEQVKCSSRQQWVTPAGAMKLGVPKPVSELLQEYDGGDLK